MIVHTVAIYVTIIILINNRIKKNTVKLTNTLLVEGERTKSLKLKDNKM